MNAINQQASDAFWRTKDSRFGPSTGPPLYTVLECFAYSKTKPSVDQNECLGLQVLWRLHNAPLDQHQEKPTSSLQIVKIDRNPDSKLHANFLIFRQILSVCKIDPRILALVAQEGYGTEQFKTRFKNGHVDSFYLCSVSFMIIWSWDSRTKATKAIFIPARFGGACGSETIWKSVTPRLGAHIHSVKDPRLLKTVTCLELSEYLDLVLASERQRLNKSMPQEAKDDERKRGLGGRNQSEMAKALEMCHSVLSRLSSALRQNDVLLTILEPEPLELSHNPTESEKCGTTTSTLSKQEIHQEPERLLQKKQAQIRKDEMQLVQEQANRRISQIANWIDLRKAEATAQNVTTTRAFSILVFIFSVLTLGCLTCTAFMISGWYCHDEALGAATYLFWLVFVMVQIVFLLILARASRPVAPS
ncbi:hypothetical protein OQA88_8953 [Cercophora sp. LCS_1]